MDGEVELCSLKNDTFSISLVKRSNKAETNQMQLTYEESSGPRSTHVRLRPQCLLVTNLG